METVIIISCILFTLVCQGVLEVYMYYQIDDNKELFCKTAFKESEWMLLLLYIFLPLLLIWAIISMRDSMKGE